MTREQATEVTGLIRAATGGQVDEQKISFFEAALTGLDYESSLAAATMGTVVWRFFPSWAEFKEIYRAQERLKEPTGEQRLDLPPIARGKQIPTWVRRWIAARFLYARFGKDRDTRIFPEQDQYGSVANAEYMPPDAWVEEAAQIADTEVWAAISSASIESQSEI